MKVVAATLAALPAFVYALSALESPRDGFLHDVLDSKAADQKYCKPTGLIQDACCDFETVESVNNDVFVGLHELVATPFFRTHKVDLYRECPFWQEDGSCMNRACGVETTDEEHIPEAWRSHKLGELKAALPINEDSPAGCVVDDGNFCVLEDELDSEGVYVDLLENPERFTGYAGDSSSRVWKAIYEENCFTSVTFIDPARSTSDGGSGYAPLSSLGGGLKAGSFGENEKKLFGSLAGPRDGGDEVCLEKRVFYRLISGLHASISIHICDDYLDQTTGKWAPNLQCFITRIAQHPERLQNVYFTYVVALRALSKAGPQILAALEDNSGDGGAANGTRAQLEDLINRAQSCPSTFDETSMFTGASSEIIKSEFKEHFRNVSRIMDCVGCDKCRLWGKLQVTGLGTALKLLFSTDASPGAPAPVLLSRGELVSFVNALHRLSESLASVERFRVLWAKRDAIATPHLTPPVAGSSASPPQSQSQPPKSAFNSVLPKAPREPSPSPDPPLDAVVGKAKDIPVAARPEKPTPQGGSVPKSSAKSGREGQELERAGVFEWLAGLCRDGFRSCFEALAGARAKVEL